MPRLVWDNTGERLFETGVQKCVLFVKGTSGYEPGVAWNGVVSITEKPSGAEATPIYADNTKYLNLISAEDFAAAIEAYMYPDEFALCDGSAFVEGSEGIMFGQQPRKTFGLAYISNIGNDIDGNAYGEKIHLIYNCVAAPTERSYSTTNDSPEVNPFSWEINTTPVPESDMPNGMKPSAIVTIDSKKCAASKYAAIKSAVFGETEAGASLPTPRALLTLASGS